jgi:hypothetical protein
MIKTILQNILELNILFTIQFSNINTKEIIRTYVIFLIEILFSEQIMYYIMKSVAHH